jgi:thioredoxin reductase (NADPH)
MAAALRSRGVAFVEFDVDADPVLEEKFGELVPVLTTAADEEICHYRLDAAALQKALLK